MFYNWHLDELNPETYDNGDVPGHYYQFIFDEIKFLDEIWIFSFIVNLLELILDCD